MPEYSGPLQSLELSSTLWLIPLLPFLGAVINAFVGWKIQKSSVGEKLAKKLHIGSFGVSAIAIGMMLLSFGLSVWHVAKVVSLPHDRRFLYCHLWEMVRVGTFDLSFDFSLDPLSSVMLLVVTGVGTLIHIYAAAYMETEPAYWRFFSYFNLFIFSMLLLVLGDNFIVMFFGWEGVGLCSYLLIGFWYRDYKKASAGTKAFLTNRVGDFGFLTGMFILVWGLNGSWAGGQFTPDQTPRLVPVVVDSEEHGEHAAEAHAEHAANTHDEHKNAEAAHGASPHDASAHEASPHEAPKTAQLPGKAYLTFTAFPGAVLYANGDKDHPIGTSPFVRKEISAQRHSFRIIMGGATEDLSIDHALIPAGKETILAAVGPVLSFRQLHNQLEIKEASSEIRPFRKLLAGKSLWGIGVITLACLGFFVGAAGKSAQLPLYVWLPDAMAGPTPVSALIHAATMVTSGVYMVSRLNFLFSMSPTASGVVAFVGALTALFAASIGFFQYDIKKVLAYSTVSQLGFMFIGVGVGAYWAGIFHVMTHAFFKACLFLASGSVIHGMHAVEHDADRAQDMRIMGGLGKVMPLTRGTYFVACLAITAAPFPLFAGFWSKDEILWKAFNTMNTGWAPGPMIYVMGLVAALGTSFYMWRSYYLTFTGEPVTKTIPQKVHESPPMMTYVLVTLAILSTFGGAVFGLSRHLIGQHSEPLLEEWLHPVTRHAQVMFRDPGLAIEYAFMAGSVAAAIAMWALARKRYGVSRPANWEDIEQKLPGFSLINHKYYVDEIYEGSVSRGVLGLRLVLRDMDKWVVDGIVNMTGSITVVVAHVNGLIDKYFVDGAVNWVAKIVLDLGADIRKVQTGRIQNYAYALAAGGALIAFVQYVFFAR